MLRHPSQTHLAVERMRMTGHCRERASRKCALIIVPRLASIASVSGAHVMALLRLCFSKSPQTSVIEAANRMRLHSVEPRIEPKIHDKSSSHLEAVRRKKRGKVPAISRLIAANFSLKSSRLFEAASIGGGKKNPRQIDGLFVDGTARELRFVFAKKGGLHWHSRKETRRITRV